MRLLTAIPLLFWTSTAAIAHLAVILAAQPSPAVTHARSAESAIAATPEQHASFSAEARFAAAVFCGPSTCGRTALEPPAPAIEHSVSEGGSSRLTRRILHAARLSANPPPAQA